MGLTLPAKPTPAWQSGHSLATGCLAFWALQDGSGDPADSSGNSKTATLGNASGSNPTWSGTTDKRLDFVSANKGFARASGVAALSSKVFSYAVLMKSATVVRGTMLGEGLSSDDAPLAWVEPNETGGYAQCRIRPNTGGGSLLNIAPNTAPFALCDDTWHLVVVTCDGTTVKLYVDGSANHSDGLLPSGSYTLDKITLGCADRVSQDYHYTGALSMAGAWNRVLTDEEIDALATDPWAVVREPAGTTITVDDASLVWSPYNWFTSGSTYKQATSPGAYLKFGFAGTSLAVAYDNAVLSGVTAGSCPVLKYSLDGGAWQRKQLTGDSPITLAESLADETHSALIVVEAIAPSTDDKSLWTPAYAARITGIVVDYESEASAPTGTLAEKSGVLLCYGDSNTMAASVRKDSAGNRVGTLANPSATVFGANDATWSWAWKLAEALDCEVGILAYGSQGYTLAGNASVPDAEDAWDFYHDSASRLVDGLLDPAPDYIVNAWGSVDGKGGASDAAVTAAVAAILAAQRAAAPSAKIYFATPLSAAKAAAILAGAGAAATLDVGYEQAELPNAYADGDTENPRRKTFDGVHMLAEAHAEYAVLLSQAIQGAAAPRSGGPVVMA